MCRERVRRAGRTALRWASPAALLLAFVFVGPARADRWILPEKRTYYSPNKRFAFEVTPKKLESQLKYFSDKVNRKPNAGAAEGVEDNRCKGAFLEQRGRSYARRAAFALVNEVSPVEALVADSGRYVVTFDNWHSVGYGDDAIVIYLADGTLVRKFGLEELLTEQDIATLPRSVSSMWWGGEHYLDEPAGHLVLRVVADGEAHHGEPGKYQDLRIALATGLPVEPKRDLFMQLHRRMFPAYDVTITADGADEAADSPTSNEPPCAAADAGGKGAARVASAELLARAELQVVPIVPPIAKAARASGKVVVEMLVDEGGGVSCARAIGSHALLRQAAVNAARGWKFRPHAGGGKQLGRIAFDFRETN